MGILGSLRVRTKIVVGYIIILVIIAAVGGLAIVASRQITSTISNLADDLAAEQHLADQIVSQIWTTRFFAQKYINQQLVDDLVRFNAEIANFDTLLAEAEERISTQDRRRTLDSIQAGTQEFRASFYEVVNLIDERTIVSQGVLDIQGSLAELRLDQLRESLSEVEDAAALYYAGNAERAYLQIRLNTFRYLATGDEQWVSERRYQEATDALRLLGDSLQDPNLRQLAEEAGAAVQAYIQGLSLIQDNFSRQKQIVSDEINVVGVEIERAGAAMSASVTADFQAASERTQALVGRARLFLVVSLGLVTALGLGFGLAVSYGITRPITALTGVVRLISAGDLEQRAPVITGDEIGELGQAFNRMTETIQTRTGELRESIRIAQERTQALEISAEVSRAASSILDPRQLIPQVVELIRERFGLYYVGLFQVDASGEWAVLQAGTGEAGRAMLARGHRIRVGEGMVGWSISNAQARIASRAEADAVRLAIPELPETRSEAALPLRSRGQVLGALSVQDARPDAFDEATLTVLQTMADQVAVALDNARLFAQAEEALEAERRAYGEIGREAWVQLLTSSPEWGYRCTAEGVSFAEGDWLTEMAQAASDSRVVPGPDGVASVALPIRIRDEVIGALNFRKEEGKAWTDHEIALLRTLADQLGQALDSARLFQDTQQRAARDRLMSEITARMRETLDVSSVLETAANELYEQLGLEKVMIHLAAESDHQPPHPRSGDSGRGQT